MKRRHLLIPLLFSIVACKKNATTPPGSEAFHWTRANATRASVPNAKELGPHVVKEMKLQVTPDIEAPITLTLRLETAPLEIVESTTTTHTSPVDVKVTVDSNTDWTVGGKCFDGPDYLMGDVDKAGKMTTPGPLLLRCSVDLRYLSTMKDLQSGVSLEILGDGKVTASMGFGKVTVE